jgi:hypothetical protein
MNPLEFFRHGTGIPTEFPGARRLPIRFATRSMVSPKSACPAVAAEGRPVRNLGVGKHNRSRTVQVPESTTMNEIPLNFLRELNFEIKGEKRRGKLSIESLNFNDKKKKWECRWSLDHLYSNTVSFTGDDPLSALVRTLEFASDFVRGSNEDGFKVYWQFEGDNAGLPFKI